MMLLTFLLVLVLPGAAVIEMNLSGVLGGVPVAVIVRALDDESRLFRGLIVTWVDS